jgi:hypothetical protein
MSIRTVVAADRGFEQLELLSPDSFTATPVVAWMIVDPDSHSGSTEAPGVYPLSAGWADNEITLRNKIIRQPNGVIVFLDSLMTFKKEDEAEALKYAGLRLGLKETIFAA